MLQIKNISKQYITGELRQDALKDVSLALRDNEFVAILGPSGSGKTTLLNIIGGLDRYDSGDLIIGDVSTKKYKDRDWDSYRNHTIGFVFQSYNLIPHQSVLANVELALTISGISRRERRRRAKEALEAVGLGNQLHKRPNQMSGGQMQRVAIARALVNNPDILLADEPTGALDTDTSVQVMELLKEVAKDRLVVMVTHNPELAEQYANRIVRLRDGQIVGDTNPLEVESSASSHRNLGKASMSFATAISLSFNNLRTKLGRTLLTAFAGSIGIIGIALILALSTGVNDYIADIQKSTMTSYPISIESQTVDLSGIMNSMDRDKVEHSRDGVYTNGSDLKRAATAITSVAHNNLSAFKKYLDDPASPIHRYVGETGIIYSYAVSFSVYTRDTEDALINTNGSTLGATLAMVRPRNLYSEMLPGVGGQGVSQALKSSYDLVYGTWPEAYDEVILTLNRNSELNSMVLYQLGLLPGSEYRQIVEKIKNGEEFTVSDRKFSYEEICDTPLYLLPSCDSYVEDNGLYVRRKLGDEGFEEMAYSGLRLKIVGIVCPSEDSEASIGSSIGYTRALTEYLLDYTDSSAVVRAQLANPNISVLTGLHFAPEDDAAKIADAMAYLTALPVSEKAKTGKQFLPLAYAGDMAMLMKIGSMGEIELAQTMDAYLEDPADDVLLTAYERFVSPGTLQDNLDAFGVVDRDTPDAIHIYTDSFEGKEGISQCIEDYNRAASEEDRILYTDYVALLMSSVTTIVNVISYVLIAFVAVSLVVSSIMIGIITYISVLERTKEIGILRAIGASKKNISQVFNAETFLIGLCAGAIGIGVTLLLEIPINAIIHMLTENNNVNATLPLGSALVLVVLSVLLTLLGGLIPSRKAAKKDPVAALRSE